jgi:uncharacterized membrane protein
MHMTWTDTARIDAPVELVWRLVTEVAGWPALTPTMTSVERLDDGPLRVGSRARIEQPRQRPAVWTVTELDPGRGFVWQTERRGLTMTATHRLVAEGTGCRNTLDLRLTGALARPLGWLIGPAVRRALHTENAGFKAHAERLAAPA